MKPTWFAILVVAGLGWFAIRYVNAQRQRIAVEALTAIDAQVVYRNQAHRMGGPFIPESVPPGPKWLHPLLGVDFFDPVVAVYGDFEFSDAHVRQLSRLPGLRTFQAEGSLLTDAGIAEFAKIKAIRLLNISGSQLTDKGTMCFQNLPNLEVLQLWHPTRLRSDSWRVGSVSI